MYKFIKTVDETNRFDTDTLELSTATVSLPDLIQSFEYFLKGCGFQFKGSLEIVEEDDSSKSDCPDCDANDYDDLSLDTQITHSEGE